MSPVAGDGGSGYGARFDSDAQVTQALRDLALALSIGHQSLEMAYQAPSPTSLTNSALLQVCLPNPRPQGQKPSPNNPFPDQSFGSHNLLQALLRLVERKYSVEAMAEATSEAEGKAKALSSTSAGLDTKAFPLGFATGEELVNSAATVLRLLYIVDMREVQTAVNALIAALQAHTAHPTTDASLGKVGY